MSESTPAPAPAGPTAEHAIDGAPPDDRPQPAATRSQALRAPAWSAIAAFALVMGALLVARGLHAWGEHAEARAIADALAPIVDINLTATDAWPTPDRVRDACDLALDHAQTYTRADHADPGVAALLRARASALSAAPSMYAVLYERRNEPETHEAFANAPFTRLAEISRASASAGREESWGFLAMGWSTLLVPLFVLLRRRGCGLLTSLSLTGNAAALAVIAQALLYVFG